jgi:hypothetical protein
MKRVALLTAVATAVTVLLPVTTAYADAGSRSVPLSDSTWYWREQQPVSDAPAQPPMLTDPSVPAGDLPVANGPDPTQPDKVSLFAFDLGDLPTTATVDAFRLTLPLDPAATFGQAYTASAPPALIACAVGGPWIGGSAGRPFSTKPKDDCTVKVTGKFDAAKPAWTFDLTAIASRWLQPGANHGVVVLPDPTATAPPYQVVFGPAQAISATVSWSDVGDLAAPTWPLSSAPATSAPLAPAPLQVGAAPPPVSSGNTGSAPVVALPPSVAPAAPAVRVRPVASLRPRGALMRTSAAALVGLLVLLLCSLSVAAPRKRAPRAVTG